MKNRRLFLTSLTGLLGIGATSMPVQARKSVDVSTLSVRLDTTELAAHLNQITADLKRMEALMPDQVVLQALRQNSATGKAIREEVRKG